MVAHNTLTGAELHESKGANTAAINTVPVADGAGAAPFQALTYAQMPSGSLIGLASSSSNTVTSTTSVIPVDSSIPQNSEGAQILSISYTPKMSTSTLLVEGQVIIDATNTFPVGVTIFKDAETSARAVFAQCVINLATSVPFLYSMVAGTTSPITFYIRFSYIYGTTNSYTVTSNRINGNTLGGILSSFVKITEIKA